MATGEARVPIIGEERRPSTQHEMPRAGATQILSRSTTIVISLAAGAAAGAIAKTVIAPLDRTKINFQISNIPYSWKAAFQFILNSAKSEGLTALWRGNSATMARIVPYAAIQFTAHDQWKRVLGVDAPLAAKARPYTHLLSGSLAGVTSQSLTYPLDMARARMAVYREYATLGAVFRQVVRQEGLVALYRGFSPTILGVIPYAGISFFTYDTLKQKYLEAAGPALGPLANVGFGAAAGALSQSGSYPLDVARRRMQTARDPPGARKGLAATLRHVYTSEGWRGFFKGLSMNWVKGPVAVGISFASYDAFKDLFRSLALRLSLT